MKKTFAIFSLILITLLSSCSKTQDGWVAINYGNSYQATYQQFDGSETERVPIDAGDTFILTYDATVENGTLTLRMTTPDGVTIWEETFIEDAHSSFKFTAQASGIYTLYTFGENTQGGFKLVWEIEN